MNPQREKGLFLTLWGFIVLVASLFWLWPHFTPTNNHPSPDIELAKNLSPIFQSAQVTPTHSFDFRVALSIQPDYRSQISREPQSIELGVRFLAGESILEEKTVSCVLNSSGNSEITIPNPQRFYPKRVLIYLPH